MVIERYFSDHNPNPHTAPTALAGKIGPTILGGTFPEKEVFKIKANRISLIFRSFFLF
jgi:hypothetical protein